MEVSHAQGGKYRFGEWGPQYLFHGAHCEGGEIKIPPGKRLDIHYHNKVEEVFYVVRGNPTILCDEGERGVCEGDLVYIEPRKSHSIRNDTNEEVEIFFVKAPNNPGDRVKLEEAVK